MKEAKYNDIYTEMEKTTSHLSIELWMKNRNNLEICNYIDKLNKLKEYLTTQINMV